MKQTIDLYAFINAFRACEGCYEQLGGREGLEMLFYHLEDLERGVGEEYELDVIGLCCHYACDTVEDIVDSYAIELDPDADEDECSEAVMAYLKEHTIVVVVGQLSDDRILYQ